LETQTRSTHGSHVADTLRETEATGKDVAMVATALP
jgi:hypothetical protein